MIGNKQGKTQCEINYSYVVSVQIIDGSVKAANEQLKDVQNLRSASVISPMVNNGGDLLQTEATNRI